MAASAPPGPASGGPPGRPPAPPAAPARTRYSLARRLRIAATERVGLKAAALFLSFVLWLVVSAEEPTEVPDLPVRLAVTTSDTLVRLVGEVPPVTARVVVRARELLKLYAQPPVIRRTIGSDAPETMVIRLGPADVDFRGGVEGRVRDVSPRLVTLHFDVRAEKSVRVRSALMVVSDSAAPGAGFEPLFQPESVKVTGSRAAVDAVTAVATVPLTLAVRDSSPAIVALDTTGLGVRVSPTRVRVVWLRAGDSAAAHAAPRP